VDFGRCLKGIIQHALAFVSLGYICCAATRQIKGAPVALLTREHMDTPLSMWVTFAHRVGNRQKLSIAAAAPVVGHSLAASHA